MAFSRVRPPGFWSTNSTVLPDEWEKFDDQGSKAIDGTAGGVYAPSSAIVIGGSGLEVTGPLVTSGGASMDSAAISGGLTVGSDILGLDDLTLQGDATIQGSLEVQTDASVFGDLDVDGTVTAAAGEITLLTAFTLETGSLLVNGVSEFTGDAVFHGTTTLDDVDTATITLASIFSAEVGALEVNGVTSLNGPTTLTAQLTKSGAGRITHRITNAPNTNATFAVASEDVIVARNGVVLGALIYAVSNSVSLGFGSRA